MGVGALKIRLWFLNFCFSRKVACMIRFLLVCLLTILLSSSVQENACARCLLKSCICCLWCLEKCLNYLNQVKYTHLTLIFN